MSSGKIGSTLCAHNTEPFDCAFCRQLSVDKMSSGKAFPEKIWIDTDLIDVDGKFYKPIGGVKVEEPIYNPNGYLIMVPESLLIEKEYEREAMASLYAEREAEVKRLRAALEDAVQAVNTMQTLLMQSGLVTNSGAVSANIKLAFNRGAKFLSDNSEMQTAYLKSIYKQREALAGGKDE